MKTTRSALLSGLVIAIAVATASCGGTEQFPSAKAPAPAPTSVPGSAPSPTSTSTSAPAPTGVHNVAQATPKARLLAAVQEATESKSSRIALDMTVSGIGTAGAVSVSGSGVTDLARRQMQLTFQVNAASGSGSIEMRIVGNTAYLKEGDTGWVSMSYDSLTGETPNPQSYLDSLQSISDEVHVEGHDTLRGTATTRYGATIDLKSSLARAVDPTKRAAVQREIDQLGIRAIPATVWVDDAGRLRKLRISFGLASAARSLQLPAGVDPKIVMSLELYDFGVPVDVQVPAGASDGLAQDQDIAAKSDLRNALTAEKTKYTDDQTYSADLSLMRRIEPSLGWGGKLEVEVGDVITGDHQIVCLSERSKSGTVFSIGDVGTGPVTGTYYGSAACPTRLSPNAVAALGASW